MAGLLAAGAVLLAAGNARADHTGSLRTNGQRSNGARTDITVPYLTSGGSAFLRGSGVAPRIYNSPTVDDPKYPQAKPVFNLIYYGSKQGFGDKSNGAKPRTP
jgi:hypothetical protein